MGRRLRSGSIPSVIDGYGVALGRRPTIRIGAGSGRELSAICAATIVLSPVMICSGIGPTCNSPSTGPDGLLNAVFIATPMIALKLNWVEDKSFYPIHFREVFGIAFFILSMASTANLYVPNSWFNHLTVPK